MVTNLSLCDDLTADQKLTLGQAVFGTAFTSEINRLDQFQDFFAYYSEQVALLRLQPGSQYRHNWPLPVHSHEELLEVIKVFQLADPTSVRPTIREEIRKKFNVPIADQGSVNEVINIALRLWLRVNFRNHKHRGMAGGRPCIQWEDNVSLKQCLAELFRKPELELTPSQCRLSPHFTAANMKNICQLKIQWTTSLEDHLRLDREHRTMWIFCDRQFVLAHVATVADR